MLENDIKNQIEIELKKRNKSIRNKNAIEKFLGLFGNLNALYGVLKGSEEAIEVERQKLKLEKVLDLLIGLDAKLEGKEIENMDSGLEVIIHNVKAEGNITGLSGPTSSDVIQKVFEKPVHVSIKDSHAGGYITGVSLDVDKEMKVKGKTKIETDMGSVEFNPDLGDITFGSNT